MTPEERIPAAPERKRLTVVSHTHWDREWYQPFQEFRIRLVQLVDGLLEILGHDPDYRHFTLDGQTILVEDYLAVRPEREEQIRQYVQDRRLSIGPWYILPDEFLVSPEATVRNLILGDRTARRYGAKMAVGYVPDSFGHISQLPQILRGFDMDAAVLWRGVGGHHSEFRWAAPDGSEVLVVHLRQGYGNAAHLPDDEVGFAARLQEIAAELGPDASTRHLLAMNGTDHLEPMPSLAGLVAYADAQLAELDVRQGALDQFVAEVRAAQPDLGLHRGEMRSPERAHLLPGVLSTHTWIKQRNARCETLLEKWAEPFSAWAYLYGLGTPTCNLPALTWQAWRYLIQNHPHDSICGCSVDAVHKEMDVRFDWVEQIGEEVAGQSLKAIAEAVDTTAATGAPVIVFNPIAGPRTDLVTAQAVLAHDVQAVEVVDWKGQTHPGEITGREEAEIEVVDLNRQESWTLLAMMRQGVVRREGIQAVEAHVAGEVAVVEVTHAPLPADVEAVERGRVLIAALVANQEVRRFQLRLTRQERLNVRFVAHGVPGYGYGTFRVQPALPASRAVPPPHASPIENEFLIVDVDHATGTLTLTDKTTGTVFAGLHQFVDGGDRGDEYNYCRPEHDRLVTAPATPLSVRLVESGPDCQTLEIGQSYRVPARLGDDRAQRSDDLIPLSITTRISLSRGVPRLDLVTSVENRARDHRLRVHFPTPIRTGVSHAEGHFDVLTRPLSLPQHTEDWPEQPVPTHPQRTFVDVNDGQVGLLVANRGLPEYEVMPGQEGVTIALTLLRCVGWLSRDDLHCRRGHAGPGVPTPGAQCIGTHVFEYALVPHKGGWEKAYAQAHAFNAPLRAVTVSASRGPLPAALSPIEASPPGFCLSAIKQAEDGQGLIVRGYNVTQRPLEVVLRLARTWRRATRVNLNEEPQEELALEGNSVRFVAQPKQIVTVQLEV
jgi:alpha-mannosidase